MKNAFIAPKPAAGQMPPRQRVVVGGGPRLCGQAFGSDFRDKPGRGRPRQGLRGAARPHRQDQGGREGNGPRHPHPYQSARDLPGDRVGGREQYSDVDPEERRSGRGAEFYQTFTGRRSVSWEAATKESGRSAATSTSSARRSRWWTVSSACRPQASTACRSISTTSSRI